MSTYAIGDLQGCLEPLLRLLDQLRFDPARDRVWFTGDLVNRGPRSLETLRFVRDLGAAAVTVLGNHDLHLLAIAADHGRLKKKDTLAAILAAPDRDELLGWLAARPLLHHDPGLGFTLVHAGLPPEWDLATAQGCAAELEAVLRGPDAGAFYAHMYGNRPDRWNPGLKGWERLRYITNCFTRLRYCDRKGRLELTEKGPPGSQAKGLMPWFHVPGRASAGLRILFGHWSTLALAHVEDTGVYPLDSGCIWGGQLTALELETGRRTTLQCPETLHPRRGL